MRHRGWVLFGVVAGAALLAGSGVSSAENRRKGGGLGKKPIVDLVHVGGSAHPVAVGHSPNVVGTLTYDNDIPFAREGTLSVPIGNRFDNGVTDPHSIQKVTFRAAGCFQTPYPQFRLSVFDINPTAMTNMLLQGLSGGGACSSGSTSGGSLRTAMLAPAIVGHAGPFIGALFNTGYPGCSGATGIGGTCEGVALSMGGTDPGMGFHAIRVGGSMSTAQNLGTRNAIFRATGDNLPVELMNFGVN